MNTDQGSRENFSLSEGGPVYEALLKMNLLNKPGKLALAGLCITWLPLVIFSAFEGSLYTGAGVTFFKDAAIQFRLLAAMPILIMARLIIDNKVSDVLRYFSAVLMTDQEKQPVFTTAMHRAKILTSSSLTEIVLLLIVISTTISLVKSGAYSELNNGQISWMAYSREGNQNLTLAGHWVVFISLPLFQLFLYRWIWRYFVWVLLLFRFSRARLNLLVTHSDKTGGLGILLLVQKSFLQIFVAGSVVISGELIMNLIKHPDTFTTIRNELIGYVVLCLILILFPLIFFTGKLVRLKQEGLLQLSKLGADLSAEFEKEWINDKPIEKRLTEKQVDPSMLTDFDSVFESMQQIRPVPITLRDVIGLTIPLLAPFLPLLLIHFSVMELVQKILKLLV